MNASWTRKSVYIVLIALLLVPLFALGQPSSLDPTTKKGTPGGTLAQMRDRHNLSQAKLGEIDPAGESMKLATLGMRGVAANLLWYKANDFKMKKDWSGLEATVSQITKLQPNFVKVWEFQGHNLAYNVSVEFDDYRYRYHWVTKGIDFLVDGTVVNRDEPKLLWYAGWITGQKMGRSDEHVQFRKLFTKDHDFHARMNEHIDMTGSDVMGIANTPDSWLVGRRWFLRARDAVTSGKMLRGRTPLVFYQNIYQNRLSYAETIETEGVFDEAAKRAWSQAANEWNEFGDQPVPSSWGFTLRLRQLELLREEVRALKDDFAAMTGELSKQVRREREMALSENDVALLSIPRDERTQEQMMLAMQIEQKLHVGYADLLDDPRLPEEIRPKLKHVARLLGEKDLLAQRVELYRNTVNYEYWRSRAKVEQDDKAITARRLIYEADRAYELSDHFRAQSLYEEAWNVWAQIFEENPFMEHDQTMDDVLASIGRYYYTLQQLDKPMPSDFVLRDLLRKHPYKQVAQFVYTQILKTEKEEGPKPPKDPAPRDASSSKSGEKSSPEPRSKDEPRPTPAGKSETSTPADDEDSESPPEPRGADQPTSPPRTPGAPPESPPEPPGGK